MTDYEWDHRNRLVGVVFKNGQGTVTKTVDYDYDALDRRITKVMDADGPGPQLPSAQHFVYDGAQVALVFDEIGSLTNRYLHGPLVDQVFADEQLSTPGQPGNVLWALTDNLGTVHDLVDSSGTVVEHLVYDSFGRITSDTNAAVDSLFAYTGRDWDPDVGLQYNRARWYDPAVGRWLSEDPIGFAAGQDGRKGTENALGGGARRKCKPWRNKNTPVNS